MAVPHELVEAIEVEDGGKDDGGQTVVKISMTMVLDVEVNRVALGVGKDGGLRVAAAERGRRVRIIEKDGNVTNLPHTASSVVFNSDASLLACAFGNKIFIMSTDTEEVQSELVWFDFAKVRLMKWINSQLLAIVTTTYIYIWQIGSSKYTKSMHGLTGSITDLSVSHNKKYFLLVSDSGLVLVDYRGGTPEIKIINADSGAFAKNGSNVVFVKAECGKNDNNVNTITIHVEGLVEGKLGPSLWSTTFTVLEDSTSHLPIYLHCHDGVGFVVTSDSIYIVNLATRGVLAAQKVTVGNESIYRATGAGGTIYVITTKRRILDITIAEDREDTDSGPPSTPTVAKPDPPTVTSANANKRPDPPGASPLPSNDTPPPAVIAQEREDVDANFEQEENEDEESEEESEEEREREEDDEEEADDDEDTALNRIVKHLFSQVEEGDEVDVPVIADNLAVSSEKVMSVCDMLVPVGIMERTDIAQSILPPTRSRPRRIAPSKIKTYKEPDCRSKRRQGDMPHFHHVLPSDKGAETTDDDDDDVQQELHDETRRAFLWRGTSDLPGALYQLQTTNIPATSGVGGRICQLLLNLFLSNDQLEFLLSDAIKHLIDQLQGVVTSDEVKRLVPEVVGVLEAARILKKVVGTESSSLEQHSLKWMYCVRPTDICSIGRDNDAGERERRSELEGKEEQRQRRVGVNPDPDEPESHRPDPEADELPIVSKTKSRLTNSS